MKKISFFIVLAIGQGLLAQQTDPRLEGLNHVQCTRQYFVTGQETVTDYPAMAVHESGTGRILFTDSPLHTIELSVENHKIRSLTIEDLVSKTTGTFGNYQEGSVKVGGAISNKRNAKKIVSVYTNCSYVRAK